MKEWRGFGAQMEEKKEEVAAIWERDRERKMREDASLEFLGPFYNLGLMGFSGDPTQLT